MKKIFITFTLVILILIGISFYCLFFQESLTLENKKRAISAGGHEFAVEIADNQKERSKGLGGRENLCDSCGMLFEFTEAGKYSFWMKDMKFALDIIWIKGGKIVYIAKNITSDFKGTINPPLEADRVLEINAGLADKYGFKEGDKINIE